MTKTMNREKQMEILREVYTGEPQTGWNNILYGIIADFEAYAEDEVSGFIADKFESGEIDEDEMLYQFEQFITFCIEDISEYDVI